MGLLKNPPSPHLPQLLLINTSLSTSEEPTLTHTHLILAHIDALVLCVFTAVFFIYLFIFVLHFAVLAQGEHSLLIFNLFLTQFMIIPTAGG